MNDIIRIDAMIKMLREMKSDLNRLKKLNSPTHKDMTPRQMQKRNADADWICLENIKRRHELHALAVELNIAERRNNYESIILTDGWHKFNHQPREPFNQK
ncbi:MULTISPECIES: regulator [unclassified Arsenophonus]|uniref:regulator n=1 Tax=unclassified Arsenophonus TaxID=2627083 RepID=UPI0028559E99|nr:regulator [Arsenophonus sp.]MDR5609287.1 regulator [Arsenophonus sp.]MDR5613019.1 regulator [Arsenophonus sp.]